MKSFLDNVNPQHYFVLKNGFMVRNLPELATVVEHIDSDIFHHHLNSQRNDFSSWIDHVIGDTYLKNSLCNADTKEEFLSILNSRISELQTNKSNQDKFSQQENLEFDIPSENDVFNNIMGDTSFSNMNMAETVTVQQEIPPEQLAEEPAKYSSEDNLTNSPPEPDLDDELPTELPPDMPPDISEETVEVPPKTSTEEVKEEPVQETPSVEEPIEEPIVEEVNEEPQEESVQETPVEEPVFEEPVAEEMKEESPAEEVKEEPIQDPPLEKPIEEPVEEVKEEVPVEKKINLEEEVVEIREIESISLGLKEVDKHFPRGVPRICNMVFVGTMSTGKTLTALKLILEKARQGEKALYISFHDSEEKIINIMKTLDEKILDYVNSGNIMIKKLNPFEIVNEFTTADNAKKFGKCCRFLEFTELFGPQLVVVDSLSSLELSFGENKIDYRHYIDRMFKYFEKLGLLAIFIKELKRDEDVNKEFFENLLADTILYFYRVKGSKKSLSKVLKEYPLPDSVNIDKTKKEKKGFFSFLKRKKNK